MESLHFTSNQLPIPGLEGMEKAAANAQEKEKTLREQITKLTERVLKLELEVSLLRILVENPREGGKANSAEGI